MPRPGRRLRTLLRLLAPLAVAGGIARADGVDGLDVPAGFEVAEFAGPDLADDAIRLGFAPGGEVVVSGRGYLRVLHDDDHDDRWTVHIHGPTGRPVFTPPQWTRRRGIPLPPLWQPDDGRPPPDDSVAGSTAADTADQRAHCSQSAQPASTSSGKAVIQ